MIDITIPIRTPTLGVWQRMHWGRRRQIGRDIAWALLAAYPHRGDPIRKCRIRIERTSTQEPDKDGLYGGVKPLLDALQPASKRHPYGIGLIYEDNAKHLLDLQVVHVPGKASKTRILIEEVT